MYPLICNGVGYHLTDQFCYLGFYKPFHWSIGSILAGFLQHFDCRRKVSAAGAGQRSVLPGLLLLLLLLQHLLLLLLLHQLSCYSCICSVDPNKSNLLFPRSLKIVERGMSNKIVPLNSQQTLPNGSTINSCLTRTSWDVVCSNKLMVNLYGWTLTTSVTLILTKEPAAGKLIFTIWRRKNTVDPWRKAEVPVFVAPLRNELLSELMKNRHSKFYSINSRLKYHHSEKNWMLMSPF